MAEQKRKPVQAKKEAPAKVEDHANIEDKKAPAEVKKATELTPNELQQYAEVLAKEYLGVINLLIKVNHEAGKPTARFVRIKKTLIQDINRRLVR